MSSKYPEVRTVTVRIFTDKPVRKTPYQVKGVLMRQFPDEEIVPMLDGSYRQQFLYPRVQVKILNEQIYIVGIGEGVDPIKSMVSKMDLLDFGNITFQVIDTEVDEQADRFQPMTKLIRYRFVTPCKQKHDPFSIPRLHRGPPAGLCLAAARSRRRPGARQGPQGGERARWRA